MIEGFLYERTGSGVLTYVIHATVRYLLKNTADGKQEQGTARPTIRIEASSEKSAIDQAVIQEQARIASEIWSIRAFSFKPELVTVIGSK